MEAKSTDNKSFQLTENGKLLGELIYENLFFHKAEIKLTNSELYEIKQVDFWGTRIAVTKSGIEIASLVMNWRGQIVITFLEGQEFILKLDGLFHSKYIIENKDGEKIMQLDPKFNWKKFNYNYDILYDKKTEDILFVLIGIYASNYFIAAMSGQV